MTALLLFVALGARIITGEGQQPPGSSQPPSRPERPHAADVVLVGFHPAASASARGAARQIGRVQSSRRLSPLRPHQERWTLTAGQSVSGTIEALMADPAVAYAEPDYVVHALDAPNDPYYVNGSLWGMLGDGTSPINPYGSQAGEAWEAGYTGSPGVFVGVIDEGIDVLHPDLMDNVWTNPFDPVDGIDNDGNGYVDDVHGWDFFNDDATVHDGVGDDHATHVAGTIGGRGGNGIGVAGVNWNVTMISAKFLGPNGGYVSDAVRALDYLTDLKLRHGINIVASSNAWGGGGFSQALLDAIDDSGDAGMLFVAAAGNSATNNDSAATYPSNYECTNGGTRGWDCVVAVASITSAGGLSSFSSYGATTVDIGAPGSSVMSTLPAGSYGSYSGTSMAAAHVGGAVALCAAIDPGLSAGKIRQAVLSSATATSSLQGKTVAGGRLNAGDLVHWCLPAEAPTMTTLSLPDGTTGAEYASAVTADGGATPYTWSIATGALPPGLVLGPGTGLISGTPSPSAVTSTFGVSVEGADGLFSTRALTIRVAAPLQITTASLPDGSVGTAYSQMLVSTGGAAPSTWSLLSGTLPPGLSLDSATGVVAGTPTSAGTMGFTAYVTDSGSPPRAAQRAFTITIGSIASTPPGAFSKVAPSSGAKSVSTSVLLNWAASASAVAYEYCYDTSNNQACDGGWVRTTSPQASVTGLARNKAHYWQVRALNGSGTTLANGGTWWKFQTGR